MIIYGYGNKNLFSPHFKRQAFVEIFLIWVYENNNFLH